MHPLIQSLLRPEAYDHPVERFDVLETHISWVILTGPFAYKLKKPVDFGFVNFTTLDLRRQFCDEEIRLNQRLAADLYLEVKPVYGPVEQASFVGSGDPIDFAVQMRQFSQAALLPAVLARGELQPAHLDDLADLIARFHDQAAVASPDQSFGEPAAVRAPVDGNFARLTELAEYATSVHALQEWSSREFARLEEEFRERKRAGRVRECHGDMHLGNMVFRDNRIEPFDCLEFNAGLRWIDVISEVAFLVMDLAERGRPDFAFRVLNRWLEQTGDYAGLATWRWYFVYRALVRAKVASLRLDQGDQSSAEQQEHVDELRKYLQLADTWTRPRPTGIVITHGVSGSGKSFVTQQLAERLGCVRIRSDAERKRLFGEWGIPRRVERTGDPYTSEVTETVYGEILADQAQRTVDSGFPVVVDATFLRQGHRQAFRQLAERLHVPFVILDFPIDADTARARIQQRQQAGVDPSDADAAVLEHQLASDEPLTDEERTLAVIVPSENRSLDDLQIRLGSRLGVSPG